MVGLGHPVVLPGTFWYDLVLSGHWWCLICIVSSRLWWMLITLSHFFIRFWFSPEKFVYLAAETRYSKFQRKNLFNGPTNEVKFNIGFIVRKSAFQFMKYSSLWYHLSPNIYISPTKMWFMGHGVVKDEALKVLLIQLWISVIKTENVHLMSPFHVFINVFSHCKLGTAPVIDSNSKEKKDAANEFSNFFEPSKFFPALHPAQYS